jgi:hypothetical protein
MPPREDILAADNDEEDYDEYKARGNEDEAI